MHMNTPTETRNFRSQTCKVMICICWIIGLFLGMFTSVGADDYLFLMMRGGVCSSVSIPGLLIFALPFLITALAVYFSQFWLICLVVLCKAFSFGFSACAITVVFSSAAWLVRFLLMFGDALALPILMWLWLRHGSKPDKGFLSEITVCTVAVLLLGVLDFCIVSPFGAMLL